MNDLISRKAAMDEMIKTKEVWDYTYPDCPKLELWHKYLVKHKIQGKEEEYRAVLTDVDKRGKKESKFNFRAANAGYDFCEMDSNKAHFVIYANYGKTWWIEKELPLSETGKYDVTKGRRNEHTDAQPDAEAATETQEYCERYEPTYNPEDGSL